jgi:iron complex transport system permease protein
VVVSLGLGKYPVRPGEILEMIVQSLTGRGGIAQERLLLLQNVIIEVRLPRVLAACLVGAALSVAGASYQAMFVNPLVSPGLLGVLAGASFGAALGMLTSSPWPIVQAATVAGGFAAVALAVGIAATYRAGTTLMLVLGGMISGAFFTSLLAMVKYAADPNSQLPAIVYWLMGNMALADRPTMTRTSVPMAIGIATLLLMGRHLDVLSMGDEEARALGVNVRAVRATVIIAATLISTLTVVVAGIVGWVGLVVPHAARMIVGPDNRTLLPASALLGAAYLLLVDDLSRLLFTVELPIGIVTALVGIPFFLLVLRNARKGWT